MPAEIYCVRSGGRGRRLLLSQHRHPGGDLRQPAAAHQGNQHLGPTRDQQHPSRRRGRAATCPCSLHPELRTGPAHLQNHGPRRRWWWPGPGWAR